MLLGNALMPELAPDEVADAFADLVYADPELVAAEFDALIGSAFTPLRPRTARRVRAGTGQPRRARHSPWSPPWSSTRPVACLAPWQRAPPR
jgi:hypothetical protein